MLGFLLLFPEFVMMKSPDSKIVDYKQFISFVLMAGCVTKILVITGRGRLFQTNSTFFVRFNAVFLPDGFGAQKIVQLLFLFYRLFYVKAHFLFVDLNNQVQATQRELGVRLYLWFNCFSYFHFTKKNTIIPCTVYKSHSILIQFKRCFLRSFVIKLQQICTNNSTFQLSSNMSLCFVSHSKDIMMQERGRFNS